MVRSTGGGRGGEQEEKAAGGEGSRRRSSTTGPGSWMGSMCNRASSKVSRGFLSCVTACLLAGRAHACVNPKPESKSRDPLTHCSWVLGARCRRRHIRQHGNVKWSPGGRWASACVCGYLAPSEEGIPHIRAGRSRPCQPVVRLCASSCAP